MNEQECLKKMVAPGANRPVKWRGGVIQILITRACDRACYACTQNSQLGGKPVMITPENFETCVKSLKGYFGVVGIFGGNPALHPKFPELCEILEQHIPFEQRGLWCNHPKGHGKLMRKIFNPSYSNLNVHQSPEAFAEFKRDWPESHPVGLQDDSRHSPVLVSMKDLGIPEEERWELISNCDINQNWSALMSQFRGEPRAWFCEIAGAQSMIMENDPSYPDTGFFPEIGWWEKPMEHFKEQVRFHCHQCGVPLRGYGQLGNDKPPTPEQVTKTYLPIFKPKDRNRPVEVVTDRSQLGEPLGKTTDYIGNSKR